jgi:hypothetical protein
VGECGDGVVGTSPHAREREGGDNVRGGMNRSTEGKDRSPAGSPVGSTTALHRVSGSWRSGR